MPERNIVQWVYSSRDNHELSDRYDQWAQTYDADLDREFGWIGPERAVEVFSRYVSQGTRVLDAGAGTGQVGELLARMGYRDLVAMDLSPGMLEKARKKGVYRDLYQMVMGGPLDFPENSFGAVVSVGVLTVGHAPANSFDELIRITEPSGYIVFSLRPDVYENSGFKEKQAALESTGRWTLAEATEKFQPLPKGEPDVYHQVWVYRVAPQEPNSPVEQPL